jgi:hypothetical protein
MGGALRDGEGRNREEGFGSRWCITALTMRMTAWYLLAYVAPSATLQSLLVDGVLYAMLVESAWMGCCENEEEASRLTSVSR